MKVTFLPLDERPCNSKYIQMMTASTPELELDCCPMEIMGTQKRTADRQKVNSFINSSVKDADALVLSMDTFLYGGLIPSRIHNLGKETILEQFKFLCNLKQKYPNLKIYASICLMRSPQYNSSAEEPDYYAQYGRRIHRRAYLQDKKHRESLNETEQNELEQIDIPTEIVADYEGRRDFNEVANMAALQLVKDDVIDFMVIPQDDSTPFGYTALAQKRIFNKIEELNLESKVNIYPGADEVGNTLVTRAYVDHFDKTPKIYPFYASTYGPFIVPLYEDRPMKETLKYHVRACGAELVETPEKANFILAINSPGKIMQRAKEQLTNLDNTYVSYRNLNDFIAKIDSFITEGFQVSICDSAFGNGGDLSLIKRLDDKGLLGKIHAYAGWNTDANTLGTVLADSIINLENKQQDHRHLQYRLLEDVFYQAVVRQDALDKKLPELGYEDYDFDPVMEQVCDYIQADLLKQYQALNFATEYPVKIRQVSLPWHRLFEVDLEVKTQG